MPTRTGSIGSPSSSLPGRQGGRWSYTAGASPAEYGGCELETRRCHYQVDPPRIYRDENATDMPPLIRFILRRVLKAPEFLSVEVVHELQQ